MRRNGRLTRLGAQLALIALPLTGLTLIVASSSPAAARVKPSPSCPAGTTPSADGTSCQQSNLAQCPSGAAVTSGTCSVTFADICPAGSALLFAFPVSPTQVECDTTTGAIVTGCPDGTTTVPGNFAPPSSAVACSAPVTFVCPSGFTGPVNGQCSTPPIFACPSGQEDELGFCIPPDPLNDQVQSDVRSPNFDPNDAIPGNGGFVDDFLPDNGGSALTPPDNRAGFAGAPSNPAAADALANSGDATSFLPGGG